MTYVFIQTVGSKSLKEKRNTISSVTKAIYQNLNVKLDNIRVTIDEVNEENFGVNGILFLDKE
jgi:4-oxalocrotonate tautomerase family enzyme